MSETKTYPNAGPVCDLTRYRTGEKPLVGDVVAGHGEPVGDSTDGFGIIPYANPNCPASGTVAEVDDNKCVFIPRAIVGEDEWSFAARFDLVSRKD